MRNIFSSLGALALGVVIVPSLSFAEDIYAGGGYEACMEDAMYGEVDVEYCESILPVSAEIDPLATEFITVLENSLASNFETDLNAAVAIHGEDYNYDDTVTAYAATYSAPHLSIAKNGNAYAIDTGTETVTLEMDNSEGMEGLYPLNLTATFSEESVLNWDTYQFAGRFSIDSIDTNGNVVLQHIVDGVMEIVGLFEDKWIAIDFVEILEEFPELETYIAEMKADISYDLDDGLFALSPEAFVSTLSTAIEYGYVSVEKVGDTYTLRVLENDMMDTGATPITVSITIDRFGRMGHLSIAGSVVDSNYWDDSFMEISTNVSASFTYTNPVITFPSFVENDFEITNIIEMFLEFTKQDIVEETEERMFYENLNSFSGSADEAYAFIQENGTQEDRMFIEAYSAVAKKMDRRIRNKDLNVLIDYYDTDEWDISYMYDNLSYSPYDDDYDRGYGQKYVFEDFLEIYSDRFSYSPYIPWDIYENLDVSIENRGDVLVVLAKIRKAEMMMK